MLPRAGFRPPWRHRDGAIVPVPANSNEDAMARWERGHHHRRSVRPRHWFHIGDWNPSPADLGVTPSERYLVNPKNFLASPLASPTLTLSALAAVSGASRSHQHWGSPSAPRAGNDCLAADLVDARRAAGGVRSGAGCHALLGQVGLYTQPVGCSFPDLTPTPFAESVGGRI